ncbi:kinetochore-associated Ndc80 complex subunit spc25 [Lobosporangium transversale]|uniref:Kinetochore protein SPC25 n=1 Tax=Lobosporangium transversale TaxID=64571 RepID=A0A1Y2GXE3_9FUNG|nr:chromosome segregation protein Spc25-domain-containing protein [Lobosporangium transversale]KAF9898149.1 kinetochore-associated Ndc80 complex subunit spc25 [Lobosporangium transversale]ORZ26441.1 chromosome segregation protein Spc25-domain-containing protein [Lobosporangium transversale]|eukprot:XP_021884206.1 chromosome segregation protein Spc25-domain-containing protein [Lobosporangium transversale]
MSGAGGLFRDSFSGERSSFGRGRASFAERPSSFGGRSSFADSTNQHPMTSTSRLSMLPKNGSSSTFVLPTPQIDSEDFLATAATFLNDFNISVEKIKARIISNASQWVQDTSEVRESDREIREDMKVAIAKQIARAKARKKEKEEASNMARTIDLLTEQKDHMDQVRGNLEAQVIALKKEIKAKREARTALKKALDEQMLKNKPELTCFESILAMRIVGIKEDHIGFVFTRINELDWEQEYSIIVDVSQRDFSVSDCNPLIPQLPSLIQSLNETRDFYEFLKRVRKAFKDLAKK